jgi:hypothetical protein
VHRVSDRIIEQASCGIEREALATAIRGKVFRRTPHIAGYRTSAPAGPELMGSVRRLKIRISRSPQGEQPSLPCSVLGRRSGGRTERQSVTLLIAEK